MVGTVKIQGVTIATGIPEQLLFHGSFLMAYASGPPNVQGSIDCFKCSAIVAVDDFYEIVRGGSLDTVVLLDNDYLNGPGDNLFAYELGSPQHGSLEFASDGSFIYRHA